MPSVRKELKRCSWAHGGLLEQYHDVEWGRPVHDDKKLFEMLTLEGAQAGLSWETVLRKRNAYRSAFLDFDFARVAQMNARTVDRLLENPGIVRNRAKIEATIGNARAFLGICDEQGTFDRYIWRFVDGKSIVNKWRTSLLIPASTPLSEVMSKELRKRGFRFVGPTICYAFMQAVGMVNDHLLGCAWRAGPP